MDSEVYLRCFTTSFWSIDWSALLFAVLPLIVLVLLLIGHMKITPNETLKQAMIQLRLFVFICIGFSLVLLIELVCLFNATVVSYAKGDYNTVEGTVEYYSSSQVKSKPWEKFVVDGVKFEYGDSIGGSFSFCYRKTAAQGGAIHGNGQHVRIGYVKWFDHICIVSLDTASGLEQDVVGKAPNILPPQIIACICLFLLLISLCMRWKANHKSYNGTEK